MFRSVIVIIANVPICDQLAVLCDNQLPLLSVQHDRYAGGASRGRYSHA